MFELYVYYFRIKDSKLIIDRSCDDGKDLGVYTQNRISSFECIKKKISYPIKTKSIEYILKQMILAELQQIFTIECDDSLERAYFERKMIFLTKELILLNHKDINNNWKNINKQRIQLILTISNTISEFCSQKENCSNLITPGKTEEFTSTNI